MSTAAKQLNPKHKLFAKEYLVDLNATQAAIRAGYSERTAEVQGCRLLRHAKVKEYIQQRMEKRAQRLDITADRVLQEIAKLAFFDPRKFFNENGTAKEITQLDDDTAAALAGVEVFEEFEGRGEERVKTGYTKKFKLVDKGINLERLGKHLKLFTDKVELEDVTPVTADERRKRIAELLARANRKA